MSDQPAGVDQQHAISASTTPQTESDKEQQQAARDYRHALSKNQLSMKVKVHSPFRDYYDGQAFSLTAKDATGTFDILPRHHNFISLLDPCDMIIRTVEEGEQRIRISGGIMHVKANEVIVFLDV